jgi:hypothetical protein
MKSSRPRAAAARLGALVLLAACGPKAAETAPDAAPEPAVAAASPTRASVCAPSGYLTENIVTRFGDVFTSGDSASVRRRRGMKVARLRTAPTATVADETLCARVVRAIAPREPAAAKALGRQARGPKASAAARPVRPAAGGVLAVVKVGPYYLAQDATPRPNEARSAPTYVLDGSMRLKGVFQ